MVNSRSICQIFNAEVGFFKLLDAIHELLEVPLKFNLKFIISHAECNEHYPCQLVGANCYLMTFSTLSISSLDENGFSI